MTVIESMQVESKEVDITGRFDEWEGHQIQYLSSARRQPDGTWRAWASVSGALCIVEVKVFPDIKE